MKQEDSTSADSSSRRALIGLLLFTTNAISACKRKDRIPLPIVDLLVETDGDLLAFKQTELTVRSGDHVRLTFRHTGKYISFDHNWVLIPAGTFDAITKAAIEAGEKNGWVPPNDARVLAATRLCGKGETAIIEFVAPAPGDYLYICTTPGHAESMWGVLHVTAA